MNPSVRRVGYQKGRSEPPESVVDKEWLVTNGLGGYASGTVAGVITRGFHGYLVAALPTPLGRILMLNDLFEKVELQNGQGIQLSGEERVNTPLAVHGFEFLDEFCLEDGNPVWTFHFGDVSLEKRVLMVHRQNTVHVTYQIKSGPAVKLMLRPSVNFRPHEAPVSTPISRTYAFTVIEDSFEIASQTNIPPLRLMLYAKEKFLTMDRTQIQEIIYRIEESRGYAARGDLWSPGFFSVVVAPGEPVTFVASVESWDAIRAVSPQYAVSAEAIRRKRLLARAQDIAPESLAAELVLAADQFIIVPEGRGDDTRRALAAGDEVRTVIAGYPWFTDWGRDTMIALEGLTLTTGRYVEAGYILRTFAYYVRNGLIPNMFPEGHDEGLYHTSDATLWFFHAIAKYIAASKDHLFLAQVLPTLKEIIDLHLRGTSFGIGVDETDGLLRQGKEGFQLTWMDAKVEDWVVTPRRGKAVEINALWYNALCYMRLWLQQEGEESAAEEISQHAQRARESFQQKFWNEKGGYLFDVVDGGDGDDSSLRPNQILAVSLDFPILEENRWRAVLEKVKEKLLTPVGLRTLAPGEKDYKAKYYGDLKARDAAYHQGTVWPWLMGPFIDAWLKVYPDKVQEAEDMLRAFDGRLGEYAVGSIAEIFDAEAPYQPRGCVAQAWSVSEILRSFVKLESLKRERASTNPVVQTTT
jgi:predicted glycogen debranching enzyme